MPAPEFSPTNAVAVIFIAGFAVQQVLQIIDVPIEIASESIGPKLGGDQGTARAKKTIMAFLAAAIGIIAASLGDIKLLSLAMSEVRPYLDHIITGLVIGSGTEAANSALKFIGYLKDGQKPAAPPASGLPATGGTGGKGTGV